MRIAVVARGTRGDVQPQLALAVALRAAGDEVVVGTQPHYRSAVEERGIEYAPLPGEPTDAFKRGGAHAGRGGRVRLPLARLVPSRRRGRPLLDAILAACDGAEGVVFSPQAFGAHHAAEALGIPAAMLAALPIWPTAAFPHPVLPPSSRGRPRAIRGGYRLVNRIQWQAHGRAINAFRSDVGLGPAPRGGHWRSWREEGNLHLCGVSDAVLPRPPDWPPNVRMTGYLFLKSPPGSRLDAELEQFLESGSAPVHVSFGSMPARDADGLATTVLEAAERSGERVIIAAEAAGFALRARSERVMPIDSAPHDLVLPRVGAAVHHGGAGTVGATLCAGLPTAIVPFGVDQHFWGAQVAALGAGPPPIPVSELTVAGLTAAIRAVATDEAMRARAGGIGDRIRSQDGAARAVAAVHAEFARL